MPTISTTAHTHIAGSRTNSPAHQWTLFPLLRHLRHRRHLQRQRTNERIWAHTSPACEEHMHASSVCGNVAHGHSHSHTPPSFVRSFVRSVGRSVVLLVLLCRLVLALIARFLSSRSTLFVRVVCRGRRRGAESTRDGAPGTHLHDRFFLGGSMGSAPHLGFDDRRVGGQVGERDQVRKDGDE